jgi:hypothetical protein
MRLCNYYLINERCKMPTQSLPAASLRPANRFPAARVSLSVANYLIYRALEPIGRAISGVKSRFLPALREAGVFRNVAARGGKRKRERQPRLRGPAIEAAGILDKNAKHAPGDRIVLVQPVEPHPRGDQAGDDITERVDPVL